MLPSYYAILVIMSLKQTQRKEKSLIQSGTHYSEMLPVEYQPTEDYISLFHNTLDMYC